MRNKIWPAVAILLISVSQSEAQTTTFTYQGKLSDNSMPATGTYQMQFSLFAAVSGGTPIGNETITNNSVAVSGGIFTVDLAFTDPAAFDGSDRWLEIAVKRPADPGFTTLTPRQKLNSAPYSIKSLNAANSAQLGGVAANQYVQTTDTRLSDDRNPLPNSGNYIQNTISPQSSSNFNISGNGTAGGTLTGNIVNTGTQFNIGGVRMLSNAGTRNLFVGVGTGQAITTGVDNVFIGWNAGISNATGVGNTFVGRDAGFGVINGADNSFFGFQAGIGGGSGSATLNSFFGFRSGGATATGIQNSFFGAGSGQTNVDGNFNSFFGVGAGFNNKTSANSFFGWQAGSANTNGSSNSFFGIAAGQSNTLASQNSFFGDTAGNTNTTGDLNSFFGSLAGQNNLTGTSNSFFGEASGQNSVGSFNTFIGQNAGLANSTGNNNTLLGRAANLIGGNLTYATAIGSDATVSTSNTIALGRSSGLDSVQIPGALSVTGSLTANGANLTNLNAGNFTSGLLLPARGGTGLGSSGAAGNFLRSNGSSWSSSPLLPSDITSGSTNYIQNQSASPQAGDFNISGNGTAAGTLSGNVVNATTQFNIGGSRILSNAGSFNLFAGDGAGAANTTGRENSFFGALAGQANTTGNFNAFFGVGAGSVNADGTENAIFGYSAGSSNTSGSLNSFFGKQAGISNTTGSNNSFFGYQAGINNTTGIDNTFIGRLAGFTGTNQTGNLNTLLGTLSNVSSGVSNATAIGGRALVTQSNSLVLGSINGVNGATANTNVGIGTTAPNFRLEIVDASNVGLRVVTNTAGGTLASFGGTGVFQVDAPFIPGGRFAILENGNVGIGVTVPADSLDVAGLVRLRSLASGNTTTLCRNSSNQISNCSSSIRYKTNINPFASGLSLINRLRPVSFEWKEDKQPDFGLVAEEVERAEPLLVTHNDKGQVEGVKYDRIAVVLINAVKEQQQQIDREQKLIEEQQQQIQALKQLICATNSSSQVCLTNRR